MNIFDLKSKIIESIKSEKNLDINRFIFYPDPNKGHLSIKLFPFAKMLNKKLDIIGEEFKTIILKLPGIKNVVFENGYLNIFLEDFILVDGLNYVSFKPVNKKVVVEFPSVNPNKPWHIGHLRNALLGESISRILEETGYDVERLNYINDLGLQVAESFYYYENYMEECNEKFDHCIGKQYVKAHSLVEESKEIEKKVRETLKRIEKGDKNARSFVEGVLKAQYETASSYDICSDKAVFESDLASLFESGLSLLKKNDSVYLSKEEKNKGCLVIRTEEKGNLTDEKILVRSDGTLTYTGKDIIFHLWKLGKLGGVKFSESSIPACKDKLLISNQQGVEINGNGDILINIIGIEQSYPQKVVRDAIKFMGYEHNKIIHLAYAFVRLKDKRFSGRKGTWIGFTADELLEEGKKRVIESYNTEETIAEKIALAAIKFAILRVSPKKEVIFDWDRVLSTEGDSGVYLLYSYVRALSVLRKSEKQPKEPELITREAVPLVMEMLRFREKIFESSTHYDPSILANYLLELSKLFHKFYSKVRIIGSKNEEGLLFILDSYKSIMELGMKLLGMEPIEKM